MGAAGCKGLGFVGFGEGGVGGADEERNRVG
jgi:hypothetical protein